MLHNDSPSLCREPRRFLGIRLVSHRLVLGFFIGSLLLVSRGPTGAADKPLPKTPTKKPARLAVPAGVVFHPDHVYCTVGKVGMQLDLACPQGKGPFPAVVVLHGTGPLNKGRKGLTALTLELAQKGYAALAVQYRFEAYPGSLEDVNAALKWLRAQARKFNIDTDRVGVLGFSGGGTLGCMLAMKKPVHIRAVVSYSAPSDLALLHKKAGGPLGFIIRRRLENMLGGSPAKVAKKYAEASPVSHVHKGAAPCLLLHGSADAVVPLEQSQVLARKLHKAGADVTLLTFEHAPHDFDEQRNTNARLAAVAAEVFLIDHLKPRPAASPNRK
jgi:dipeptidyl aminopeptidase/acylaminoacyl peptidase